MELITVDGRTVAYRRAGSGAPLVLLHGGWSDSRAWTPQLAALSSDFDVIAWDTPGCGGSDDLPDGVTLGEFADAVAGLITALGVRPAHLCGISFGGGLALAVYQRHPELVRSLVLVGAYAGWKGSLPPAEVAARLKRAQAELRRPPRDWMDGYLPGFFAGPAPEDALAIIRTMMSEVRPTGLLRMLTAFADADLTDVLPTVAVPTLVLSGELDVRSPLTVAEALHASIPGSQLSVLPGVGHYVNLEAPELFDAELRRFLAAP
jgi:pimeloyl-ACP methyl ester carboxylesterase